MGRARLSDDRLVGLEPVVVVDIHDSGASGNDPAQRGGAPSLDYS